MTNYLRYHRTTLVPQQWGLTPPENIDAMLDRYPESEFLFQFFDVYTMRLVKTDTGAAIVLRESMSITTTGFVVADGEDIVFINGIPADAWVFIKGMSIQSDGTALEYSTDTVGVHTMVIQHPHYLEQEIQIEAVAPD